MSLLRPVRAASAQASDPFYAQTIFPVSINGRPAIPAGTYVLGRIDSVTRPTRKSAQATLQLHLKQILFADGYLIGLAGGFAGAPTLVTIKVSIANDLLLDNGAEVEVTLAAPLAVDPVQAAKAVALSHPPAPGSFHTATQCVETPGSAGTSDTVIAGTPGTPPTVVPGVDGGAPTIIPGTPPGPPTVLPGTPGTAPTFCPAPPLVVSSTPVYTPAPAATPPVAQAKH